MKIKYLILLFAFFFTVLHAEENKADCLILEDENSIICKYTQTSIDIEKQITIEWIEPNGLTTRIRNMKIPPFHLSVYDYRYLDGRTPGKWTFKVTDNGDEYLTSFIIE